MAAPRRLMTAFAVHRVTSIDLKPLVRFLCIVTVLAILPAFSSEATAATAELQFDSWTTENGLPQNSVNDILQTRDGYLWLATFGGLVRFDGVRFVVFDRSLEGIGSQRVLALHEDRHGTLWAATEDGMLIRYRDGRFITYGRRDGLPHAGAIRIEEEDDEGGLWITWVDGVTRLDGERFQNSGRIILPITSPPLQVLATRTRGGAMYRVRNGAPEPVNMPPLVTIYEDREVPSGLARPRPDCAGFATPPSQP